MHVRDQPIRASIPIQMQRFLVVSHVTTQDLTFSLTPLEVRDSAFVGACSWKPFSCPLPNDVVGSIARQSHHNRTLPYGVTWESNTERRIIAVEAESNVRSFLFFSGEGEGVCYQTRGQPVKPHSELPSQLVLYEYEYASNDGTFGE